MKKEKTIGQRYKYSALSRKRDDLYYYIIAEIINLSPDKAVVVDSNNLAFPIGRVTSWDMDAPDFYYLKGQDKAV